MIPGKCLRFIEHATFQTSVAACFYTYKNTVIEACKYTSDISWISF